MWQLPLIVADPRKMRKRAGRSILTKIQTMLWVSFPLVIGVAIFAAYGHWLVKRTKADLIQHLRERTGHRVSVGGDRTGVRRVEGEIQSVSDLSLTISRFPGDLTYVSLDSIHWVRDLSATETPTWLRYRARR
jgi:hypothetical protein